MGKSIKLGGLEVDESLRNLTFDEFKEFIIANKLGIYLMIDIQKAYDLLQGCKGCGEKKKSTEKPVKKPVKKKKKP